MSNPRMWRTKPRTPWPNARQKRNGLFLDQHPVCQQCGAQPSEHAHHRLPRTHPDRKFVARKARERVAERPEPENG